MLVSISMQLGVVKRDWLTNGQSTPRILVLEAWRWWDWNIYIRNKLQEVGMHCLLSNIKFVRLVGHMCKITLGKPFVKQPSHNQLTQIELITYTPHTTHESSDNFMTNIFRFPSRKHLCIAFSKQYIHSRCILWHPGNGVTCDASLGQPIRWLVAKQVNTAQTINRRLSQ